MVCFGAKNLVKSDSAHLSRCLLVVFRKPRFAVPPSGEDVWDFAGFARDLSSCAGRTCFPLQPECKDPRAKLSAVISWWGLGR